MWKVYIMKSSRRCTWHQSGNSNLSWICFWRVGTYWNPCFYPLNCIKLLYLRLLSVSCRIPSGFNSDKKNLHTLPMEWLRFFFFLFHTHLPRVGLEYYCSQQKWTDKQDKVPATQWLNISVAYLFIQSVLVHRRKLFTLLDHILFPFFLVHVLFKAYSVQSLHSRIQGFHVQPSWRLSLTSVWRLPSVIVQNAWHNRL